MEFKYETYDSGATYFRLQLPLGDKLDNLYHTVACKSAIKAGYLTSDLEKLNLAKKVLADKDVMYCPHGRPVAFEIKRSELERQFGRLQ